MKIFAINKVTEDGEKNVAVAIEYEKKVCNATLDIKCFTVTDRTITRVYANDCTRLKSDGKGCDGNYVILEMDYSGDFAKTLPFEWEVKARLKLTYKVNQVQEITFTDGTTCSTWGHSAVDAEVINEEYDKFTFATYNDHLNKSSIAFSMFVPDDYTQDKKYPLVLYWHGGGEKGNNNLKNMLSTLNGIIWASEEEQRKHPCFILVPQCPVEDDWIDPDTYETTITFDAVCRLMKAIIEKYSIDLTRVYCTGFSMGGMGAWEATKRYSKLFAATIIYAGQDNYEGLEILKDNNIWVFHGEDDDKAMSGNVDNIETFENAGAIVNRAIWDGGLRGEAAKKMANEQLIKGGNILHSQYKEGSIIGGWAHEFGWRPAITNEVVRDWLFSKVNPNYSFEESSYTASDESLPVKTNLGFDGTQIKQIAAGNRHNVAILNDGTVYAWGFNCTGQVGNGKSGVHSDVEVPVCVETIKNIVQVAAGNNFSLALAEDGTVYGWGCNTCSQLGGVDTEKRYTTPIRIEGISDVNAIDAGDNYSMALKKDGSVWTWGVNINGQLGNGRFTRSMVPIQVLDPEDVTGFLSDIVHIEAGVRTVVVMKTDGTIRCWGDGEYGQIGKGVAMHGPGTTLPFKSFDKSDPTGYVTDVCGVAEGRCFTTILKKVNTVYSWGLNRHGEIGVGDYKPELNPGVENTSDFMTTFPHPLKVMGLDDVVKITAGMNHTVALKKDGSVWTWGYNKIMGNGVLGVGDTDGSNVPICVERLSDIRDIITGFNHNFAISKDGTIWAWGNRNNGRLGPIVK